ncbi:TPA: hypothetical protein SMI48_003029 [Serratia marcescens]|nr:hypothetical protein [Serratia marcescens]HEJ8056677.1 hypothetical protein [Serratia marcescens]
MFDAVNIETAFARMLGNPVGGRGTDHDADTFRSGRPKNLAKALHGMIEALDARFNNLSLQDQFMQPGECGARLSVAIKRLGKFADQLAERKSDEPDDYHWEIIGSLVSVIAALFDYIEQK